MGSGRSSQRGFTLIEIMVALIILAGLSVLIGQSVRTGLSSKAKIQLQIQEESALRDALKLIASDIETAFHHRDFTVVTYNKILELRKKQAAEKTQQGVQQPGSGAGTSTGTGTPQDPPKGQASGAQQGAQAGVQQADPLASATPMPTPVQLTGFVGTSNSLVFTASNHVRRYLNASESDLAKIVYSLRSCKSEGKPGKGPTVSSCLVRSELTNLDSDFNLSTLEKDDSSVVLVQNVTSFKLRYIAAGQTDFVDEWDSTAKSTVGKFPDAVEVSLAIQDKENPKSRVQSAVILAPLRFANNEDPDENKADDGVKTGTTQKPAETKK